MHHDSTEIEFRAGDSGIERLYVAIFGTSGEDDDKLIVSREVTQTNAVEDITPLKPDYPDAASRQCTRRYFRRFNHFDQFLVPTKTIENEDTAPTMSSGVQTYTLKPGKNTIGLPKTGANQISASPVTIYRLIARVYLNQLFLRPLEEYGDEASFKLESVFMANVKNYSVISVRKIGALWKFPTLPLPDFFLTGANPTLKVFIRKVLPNCRISYIQPIIMISVQRPTKRLIANCAANAYTVFENMQETTWHTLLILHGTLPLYRQNGNPRNVDTYYPVICKPTARSDIQCDGSSVCTPPT